MRLSGRVKGPDGLGKLRVCDPILPGLALS